MMFDDNADDYSFRLPQGESSKINPHESPFIIIINHY